MMTSITKDGLAPRWLPKCGYCNQLILEEQCTEAEDKVWHLQCFKCFECKKTLGGQQYVMARPTVLRSNETTFNPENEYPYCLSCFDAFFAELCEECGDIIGCEIGSIKHEGRHWHANEACFKCNFCKTALLGKLFLPANDGKIYCSAQCYQYILKMYRPSSSREKMKLPSPPKITSYSNLNLTPNPNLGISSNPSLNQNLKPNLNLNLIPNLNANLNPMTNQTQLMYSLPPLPAQVPSYHPFTSNHMPAPTFPSHLSVTSPSAPKQQHLLQTLPPPQIQSLPQPQPHLQTPPPPPPATTQTVPTSTVPVTHELPASHPNQEQLSSNQPSVKSPSPSSSSENPSPLNHDSPQLMLINNKPDVIQNHLVKPAETKPREENVTKEFPSASSTPTTTTTLEEGFENKSVQSDLSLSLLPLSQTIDQITEAQVSTPTPTLTPISTVTTAIPTTGESAINLKIIPKSVTFDPSVKENESSKKCRSPRKATKEDDCCSTCSSLSSSSSDDEFDYDLMDVRRRQWIAGTRVHYVAATTQPSTSTLPKVKSRSKSNETNSKTKSLHRPIKRFQDCSLNWAEILRSKLKGR